MTAVLYTPHFVQFFNDTGAPLAGGKLYTYTAGTTTPKATYTTQAGNIENTNPVILDSQGRAIVFISGSYKFKLTDSNDVPVGPNGGITDNITNFSAFTTSSTGFFQSFSGDAATTAFTLTDNLGTDEKSLMIFSELEYSTNGTFASDTGWTKGAGWTIAAGVATATGAISTALEQTAGITLIQGKQYEVRYTVTRSAGSITPNLGGTAGTARSASGTYAETIIAGSTQLISFSTSGFTGTLDNVSVRDVGGGTIRNPGDYTVNGTALTFNKAPASGTNNIFVFAPYTLINAAGAAQTAADAAQAAQAAAEGAVNAVAYQFTFDSSTTMADPGTGGFRLNNATLSSVTAIAVDALSSVSGNPDVSDAVATWGASTNTIKGQIKISKSGTPATFALYNVTAAVTDNTSWLEITVAHVDSNGSFSASDVCYLQFTRSGDVGATGPAGSVSATSGVTASTSAGAHLISSGANDCLQWGAGGGANLTLKANMSGNSAQKLTNMIDPTDAQDYATKNYVDTKTINNSNWSGTALTVGNGGTGATSLTANSVILGNGTSTLSGNLVAPGTSGNVLTSNGTLWQSTAPSTGAMVLLGSATASNSTSLDFTSLITSAYDVYIFHLLDIQPASISDLWIRTSTNNGSSYDTSGYTHVGNLIAAEPTGGVETIHGSESASAILATAAADLRNLASTALSGTITLYNPLGTTSNKRIEGTTAYVRSSGDDFCGYTFHGSRSATADIDAVRFLMSTGNITAGTIRMYGVKKT